MATSPDRKRMAKLLEKVVEPIDEPRQPLGAQAKVVPTRQQIANDLFGGQTGQQTRENLFSGLEQRNPISDHVYRKQTPQPIVAPYWEPKTGGGGFGGLLGDIIGIIDTPRAFFVSTIKETGDLIRGDGFDLGDWWNQTADNMMMGEVNIEGGKYL